MRTDSGGVPIDFEVTGTGTPVVLLHGFPDSRRIWRHQVPALVDAGFMVVTPDQRGYGASGKPETVDAYQVPFLCGDVRAVLDTLGLERAHVVGHDWGAAVAWAMASLLPDRVDRLVTLSVGHPAVFFAGGFAQFEKSWYMLLFQFEGIAEQWLSADNWANLRAWSHHPDVDLVIADLERDGSLTPGLNWYRANVHPRALVGPRPALPPVPVPTLGVWSSRDFALTEAQMRDSGSQVAGPWRYERIDGAGHWMQLDAPDVVNRLLVDFLR